MKNNYLIKHVSKTTNLQTSTIRYYEKEGLIEEVSRDKNGIRQYTDEDITWIIFLSKLRDMEMSIKEMRKYAKLRELGNSTIRDRITMLEEYRHKLKEKEESNRKNMILLENKIKLYLEMEEKLNEK